jgi:hypothetical protein
LKQSNAQERKFAANETRVERDCLGSNPLDALNPDVTNFVCFFTGVILFASQTCDVWLA